MKKIQMFYFDECPHCRLAMDLLKQLRADEKYAKLEIEFINERKEAERAAAFDYYYVPTFFVDGTKIHEGHAEEADVRNVLENALN